MLGILYLYFLSQTLFRYRLLDLNELVGKMAVLGTLVVLLWAVYGFLLYWVGGGQEGLFLLNALVASFVILILFEPVRSWLENGINRWLLRQRTELRGRLEARAPRAARRRRRAATWSARIMTALEESRRVTDASVYLLDADGAGFDRAGFIGQAPPERLDANAERALLDRVRAGYLDLGAARARARRARPTRRTPRPSAPPLDRAQDAASTSCTPTLVFPLFGSAETEQGPWLLGLFCVRDDRTESAFDPDDIDTFRQLAIGAARVIEIEPGLRARQGARPPRRARRDGRRPRARDPQPARRDQGRRAAADRPRRQAASQPHAETAEFLEIIVEEANRLNNVVTPVPRLRARRAPGPRGRRKVDLNEVVRKTVQLLQTGAAARTSSCACASTSSCRRSPATPSRCCQVFLNLGQNALQAMPDGGTLEILTTRRRRSRLGYGQFAEVRFRDTGIGIPRDKLKKLFIPFYTTKQKGTGLGLAICHRIVNQHGGTIEVRSTLGQGSTFSVFLPAAEPVPARKVEDITETGRLTIRLRDDRRPTSRQRGRPTSRADDEPPLERRPQARRRRCRRTPRTGIE